MGKEPKMYDYIPVLDDLNLDVDLSTAASIPLTTPFDYITKLRFVYVIADAAVSVIDEPAFTKGLLVRIDGKTIYTIQNILDFFKMGEVKTYEDDDNRQVFTCEVDFMKMTLGNLGLQIEKSTGGRRVFDLYGQDDMTGSTYFRVMVEGWKEI